jgi:hypothetical protein
VVAHDPAIPDLPLGFVHGMMIAAVMLLIGAVASLLLIFPERTAARIGTAITQSLPTEVL